jgi:membrane associated rhomboid family serine protease
MSMEDADFEADGEPAPVDLGVYPEEHAAQEHALVVLAMGAACWVCESPGGGFSLAVEPIVAVRAGEEIRAYEKERPQHAGVRDGTDEAGAMEHPVGWGWHAVWLAVTGWMLLLRLADPSWIVRAGQSHDAVWVQGEWWRTFTALFIHGDVGHWIGNALSGTVFAALCARFIGAGPAWLVILACGSVANAGSSWLADDPSTISIGASTAVFAALGVFSAMAPGRKSTAAGLGSLRGRVRRFAPVIAGLVLLGWLGTGQGAGDATTDVRSHLLGFSVGLLTALAGRVADVAPFRGANRADDGR